MAENIPIDRLSEEDLLDLRICDLPLQIKGTWLEECVQQLYAELEAKGLKHFRPECYLTDEWLTPDLEPVIGIPFYLAHPVLIRLEEKMMLEAEGATKNWCMKLLRHESGHAINYAYRLYKRPKWRELFGSFSQDYPDTYRFKPYSKSFVRHLEEHYAQYHPDEDFTETFAVWLTPDSDWSNRYKGWRAMHKLEYVDRLMRQISGKPPVVPRGKQYWPASSIRKTLRRYYKQKKEFWAEEFPDFHDRNLMKLFTVQNSENKDLPRVTDIIKKYKRTLLTQVARWSGERKYLINDQLKKVNQRCRLLRLCAVEEEPVVVMKITAYVTALVMNYRYTGWLRGKR